MEMNELTDIITKLRNEDVTKWMNSFQVVLNHYFDLAASKTKEKLYSEFNLFEKKIQNEIEFEKNKL